MKNWFLNLMLILSVSITYAQGVITGVVIDAETNSPLSGASVVLKGTSKGVSTDPNGKFSINIAESSGVLEISYMGFVTASEKFSNLQGTKSVKITLEPESQSLSEVVITGSALLDIAKERKTPVAVSTIKGSEIVEKLGNREFPEILNRTPSVYATKQGGGYGDSKISIRGFAQENIAVMINGMPVNDMETGAVYWSNWAGISDVTSAMQVQRGLGASKLAIASIGGTINIITKTSDMQQGGTISAAMGNDNYTKFLASYNTGKMKSGFSTSVLLSRTAGDGYAYQTQFEGYNYFLGFGYTPNENHSLQFIITGAPQWHNQRSYASSIATYLLYGSDNEPNIRYNSDWGFLNGSAFSIRRNVYHKPVMSLNYDWKMSDASTLSSVLYASMGRGFGTNPMGKLGGKELTNASFRDAQTGLYKLDDVYAQNQASTPDAGAIIRNANINSHDWYGFLTNFNHKLNDKFSFSFGLDGRYYYGYHYQLITDLLGASAYKDMANKNLTAPNYVTTTISDTPNYNPFYTKIEPIENRIGYHNDGEVYWGGMFGQLEYSTEKLSAFMQWSASLQGFQRIDHFLKPGTLAVTGRPETAMQTKTGFKGLVGYNFKGGVNYNFNSQNNIFLNAGYYSKQPNFNAVYPNYKNYLNPYLTNEKIIGLEAGYMFKTSNFNAVVNLYRTSWEDRYLRKREQFASGGTGYSNILGIKEVHQGVELETSYRINDFVKLTGAFSFGDWFYQGDAKGTIFNEANEPVDRNGVVVASPIESTLYLDGVKVGEHAQLSGSFGVEVKPFKGFKFDASYQYTDKLYAQLTPSDLDTQAKAEKGVLQLPSFQLIDAGCSYRFQVADNQSLTIGLNVNNILDTIYISGSMTNIYASDKPSGATQTYAELGKTYKGMATDNRVYFGTGRTWNASIRYQF